MKLTQGRLIETIRKKNQGWTTYQARKVAGISIRRVNQVYKKYLISGEIPEIGIKNGRPKKPIEEFIEWYNEIRPHRSLNFEELETPQQAFIRKMKAEV